MQKSYSFIQRHFVDKTCSSTHNNCRQANKEILRSAVKHSSCTGIVKFMPLPGNNTYALQDGDRMTPLSPNVYICK